MRILQILPYYPGPPLTGGRIRSLRLLQQLSKKHKVVLVCFCKPGEDAKLVSLEAYCEKIYPIPRLGSPSKAKILTLTLSNRPLFVRFYTTAVARQTIQKVISSFKFDVIHIETYYMMHNLPEVLDIPTVLVEPNIEYMLTNQTQRLERNLIWKLIWYMDYLKQKKWEIDAWRKATKCVGVTEEDANIIQKEIQRSVDIVENSLDANLRQVQYLNPTPPSLLFIGNFLYRPNVDGLLYFINCIYPLILQQIPTTRLNIVGHLPPRLIKYNSVGDIKLWGYINVLDHVYDETQVSICPLRMGSGSRLKILDALVRGHPMVSTSIGCAGLRVRHGYELIIADNANNFSRAICILLKSFALRKAMGNQARESMLFKYSWDRSAKALQDCYHKAIANYPKQDI